MCIACRYIVILIVFRDDVLTVINVVGRSRTGVRACTNRTDLILHDGLFDSAAKRIVGKSKQLDVAALRYRYSSKAVFVIIGVCCYLVYSRRRIGNIRRAVTDRIVNQYSIVKEQSRFVRLST